MKSSKCSRRSACGPHYNRAGGLIVAVEGWYPNESSLNQGTEYSEPLNNSSSRGSANALILYGPIAQLGEHLPCKQEVAGSNLAGSTTTDTAVQEWLRLE